MSGLTQKSVTLVANVRSTLTWAGTDLSNYTASQSKLQGAYSVSVLVTNTTTQVVYLDFAYTTESGLTTALLGGKIVAGVNAGTTAQVALGHINEGATQLILGLIAAASGSVKAQILLTDTAVTDNIGAQERVISDYVPVEIVASTFYTPGISSATIYTVPANRRAKVLHLAVLLSPTPSDYRLMTIVLTSTYFDLQIVSDRFAVQHAEVTPVDAYLEAGQSIGVIVTNTDTINHHAGYVARINEIY